jgi:hypothetical protein
MERTSFLLKDLLMSVPVFPGRATRGGGLPVFGVLPVVFPRLCPVLQARDHRLRPSCLDRLDHGPAVATWGRPDSDTGDEFPLAVGKPEVGQVGGPCEGVSSHP